MYIISEAALEAVYDRLCKRLEHFQLSYAGFQLTSKYTAHFRHVFIHGKPEGTFTAVRMQFLMMALPFALCCLFTKEFALIRRELAGQKAKLRTLLDPCYRPAWIHVQTLGSMCRIHVQALNRFLNWFSKSRRMSFPVADATELQNRSCIMKSRLQRISPEKSGQQGDAPWGVSSFESEDSRNCPHI